MCHEFRGVVSLMGYRVLCRRNADSRFFHKHPY